MATDPNPYPFVVKKVYSFTLYPSVVLPGDYTGVTITSIMDYESALQLADIAALHVNVFPYLPSGTPDDPSQYDYVKVKLASGQNTVLGLPWINESTIELVESLTATVLIEGVANNDIVKIRAALAQNGFNNLTINVK